jgi:hypothetical protein
LSSSFAVITAIPAATTAFSSVVLPFPFPPFLETSDVNFVIYVAAALRTFLSIWLAWFKKKFMPPEQTE